MKMAWIHEGQLEGNGLKAAIVVSRFNSFITGRLLDGAQDCLIRHGVEEEEVDVFWVPGSWEIPAVATKLASSRSFDAVICLGAIIRGETPHFDFVASENAKGIALAGMNSPVPVVYGMITADTVDQAVDRAGTKNGNKGFDAAMTALELASLYGQINGFTEDIPEGVEE
jgi:6,7-dimethyl-8-ribityllumazine synthase